MEYHPSLTHPADGPSLDPRHWSDMRSLAHRMVDEMMDYLEDVGERPAWTPPTDQAIQAVEHMPLPMGPSSPEHVYELFSQHVLPFTKGNISPRFFSWVEGNGTALGMMADMLAAGMNANVTIGNHMAMRVDRQVVDWCRQLMGMPSTASGMLVSGGSLANITALTVARNHVAAGVRRQGLKGLDAQLVVYCSKETHNCMVKAVEVLGIGSEYLRLIPVLNDYTIDVDMLKSQIKADRNQGLRPFCLVGNAGTVNTGAIDPLDDLLAVAQAEGMWFHVDGAFGAVAKITDEFAPKLAAIAQADSMAFDLHKWLYVNYEVGCVLIRDRDIHRNAFQMAANYLTHHERGLASGPETLSNYGLELSRGFKALKVWMSFLEHGMDRYKSVVTRNIAQARYLADQVEGQPGFELAAPVSLNIVCFRRRFVGKDAEAENALNRELLMRLHESGVATPSYTVLGGAYCIRVNITNHRTQKADLDLMLAKVVEIGDALEVEEA